MTNDEKFLETLLINGEDEHTEFKTAKNSIPKDVLETISSFNNTDGGIIVLGISEPQPRQYDVSGVQNPEKVRTDFFNLLNNTNKINRNLITNDKFIIKNFKRENETKTLIIIEVPKANYKEKPIYINNNPSLTYIRQGDGDYQCTDDILRTMYRDSNNESYDSKVIRNFSLDDFDDKTIKNYRNKFEEIHAEHPFNSLNDVDFLQKIHALSIDRSNPNKTFIPTVAGLLVFGKHTSIKDYLPHYNIEYINRSKSNSNSSYEDRVIYDGYWGEDNLFNFLYTVVEKLYLTTNENSEIYDDSLTRKSNSKFRIAIREAIVNSIIHCDFLGKDGILIIRYSDKIIFRNSGTLRISKEDFFSGGHSDPRNHFIQEMFRMINLCEKAGTGIPKMMEAAQVNNYKYPEIQTDLESFELILWDTTLIDDLNINNGIEKEILKFVIKNKFTTVSKTAKSIGIHRNTASKYLTKLANDKILEKSKMGREHVFSIVQSKEYAKYDFINSMYSILEEIRRNTNGK